MRSFVDATDDEIYAYIARFGIEALVPYQVGMRVSASLQPAASVAPPAAEPRFSVEEPRRAA
ncbi:MAG: hypothetical protein IPK27_21085 [Rhodanobacteraceae bacterium]|nr:hypothetical protein [Rhodanobacteraceae bacterium]